VTVYLDSSALLRLILREPGALTDLQTCDALVSSEVTAVEAMRTVDCMRREWTFSADDAAARRASITEWLEAVDVVRLSGVVLAKAAEPFPVSLGTMNAIHLATALLWREQMNQPLVVATHDPNLAAAARAFGFDVLGA
jgi:predicted nucleic acid-binding protein